MPQPPFDVFLSCSRKDQAAVSADLWRCLLHPQDLEMLRRLTPTSPSPP
jgi:hypothetical protein